MLFRKVPRSEDLDFSYWIALSNAMQKEPTILNTRTSPENLQVLHRNGQSITFVDDVKVVGFISTLCVGPGLVELSSAWVHPHLRGTGLGRTLYASVKDLESLKLMTVFAITQSPISLRAGLHAGLVQHADWEHPVPWHLTCGPCDLIDEDKKRNCPRRNVSCWHRVMR